MVGVIDEDALEESHGQEPDVSFVVKSVWVLAIVRKDTFGNRVGRSSGQGASGPRRKASIHSDRPPPVTHLERIPAP